MFGQVIEVPEGFQKDHVYSFSMMLVAIGEPKNIEGPFQLDFKDIRAYKAWLIK